MLSSAGLNFGECNQQIIHIPEKSSKIIYSECSPLFVVNSGFCSLLYFLSNGDTYYYNLLSPGDIFVNAEESYYYANTNLSVSPVLLKEVKQETLIRSHKKALALRNITFQGRLPDGKKHISVLKFLLFVGYLYGTKVNAYGSNVLYCPSFTHAKVGAYLGVGRVIISRAFRHLQDIHYISAKKRKVINPRTGDFKFRIEIYLDKIPKEVKEEVNFCSLGLISI